jgi:hypothetical protein
MTPEVMLLENNAVEVTEKMQNMTLMKVKRTITGMTLMTRISKPRKQSFLFRRLGIVRASLREIQCRNLP